MKWVVASAVGLASPVLSGTARAQEKTADDAAKAKAAEVKSPEKKAETPKARIAVFRLVGTVKETPTEEVFNFGGETGTPLWTLVERLDKAAGDRRSRRWSCCSTGRRSARPRSASCGRRSAASRRRART